MEEPTPGEEKGEDEITFGNGGGSRSSLGGSSDAEEEDTLATELLDDDSDEEEADPAEKARHTTRRTELPSGPIGDEGSLFAVLKKNVGKVSMYTALGYSS